MALTTIVPRIRLRNARAWAPRNPARWLWAIAAFLLAFLLRLALHDALGPRLPLVSFTLATIVIHFFYGLGPALLIAAVALPVADYAFIPPYFEFDLPDAEDILLIVYYICTTALLMTLIQYLRRAQYQSVLLAEIAESRQLMLLDSEADRAAVEAEIQARDY
jgi:K+-sensing histidine kinase KdpD